MTQYIDKAAVVARIKKLIRENELYLSENVSDTVRFSKTGAYSVLNDLLHFLDTIEVKEEVTTTDAFIEKAWNWIEDNMLSSNQQDKSRLYYKQFTNYIKGGII